MSPSAVSQAISSLETRLGTPLFRRSTRSLSLTDVGGAYLGTVAPALSQLMLAADEASSQGGRPAGPLRLTMPRAPFELFVAPALAAFQDSHPEVTLEIAVEARLIDIVKEGYDAGLRYGNCIDKDMVAVLVAPKSEAILVASPSYLATRPAPRSPADLLEHRAIVCRSQGSGQIIPWALQSAGDAVHIVPTSIAVVHDLASQVNLALRGLGIANLPTAMVSEALAAGRLSRILPGWSSTLEALYLYFPSRRHQSAALRAFVGFLKAAAP
jgi:DNA-binding transcriptional LysR family regulator